MPNCTIRQTIVGSILWKIHPIWLAHVDVDRHLEFCTLCPNWFEAWIVDMQTISLGRTCIEVTLTLITHLTNTYGSHLMAFLQISNTLICRTIFEHLCIVERAPKFEAITILSVRCHHLLERLANPRAVHDMCLLNTTAVHCLYPCINLLRSSYIVVRVHINNWIFSLLNKRLRNIIYVDWAVIIQEQGLGNTFRLLLGLAASHQRQCSRTKYKDSFHCLVVYEFCCLFFKAEALFCHTLYILKASESSCTTSSGRIYRTRHITIALAIFEAGTLYKLRNKARVE